MDIITNIVADIPTVRVIGSVTAEDAPELTETLSEIASHRGARIAIDLADVASIDSSGLSALINFVTRTRLIEGRVAIVAPSTFVRGVFEITRLDSWMDVFDDPQKAAEFLKAP